MDLILDPHIYTAWIIIIAVKSVRGFEQFALSSLVLLPPSILGEAAPIAMAAITTRQLSTVGRSRSPPNRNIRYTNRFLKGIAR